MASLTGVPYLPPIVNLPTFNVEAFPSAVSFADVGVLKGIYQDTTTNQVLVDSNEVKATSLAKLYSYPIAVQTGLSMLTTYTVGTIPAGIIPSGVQALVYVSINVSIVTNASNYIATMNISILGNTQIYAQNVTYTGNNNKQRYMSQQVMFPITGTGSALNVTLELGGGVGTYNINSGTFYPDLNLYDIQVVLL
jgi:uncharacterized Fe-S radical SAM superfamily protein PflX